MGKALSDLRDAAVRNFPNGVLVVFDSELVYQLVGPDVLPFSKRKAEDMVGKTVSEIFGEETGAELEPHLRATLNGEPQSFDIVYEDRVHHIETRPTEIDGEPHGVLVTQNVTEERHTTEQLAVINRIVRHDIRNDMNIMLGWGHMLEDHVDDTGQEYLMRILNSGEHILELTNDLREIVDVLLGESEMDVYPVSVRNTLDNEIMLRRESFPHAEFSTGAACEGVEVLANELLSSVLRNLLNNAVQHNDKDTPFVEVTCERTDGSVLIRVADNGPGLSPSQKESLFEKGQRGIDSLGSGMGLYLVAKLVRQFNGRIWAEDNEPAGTVFTIQLPLAESDTNRK